MNPFSVVENMTLETNLTMDLLLVNPIKKYKCLKKDLEQQEWVCSYVLSFFFITPASRKIQAKKTEKE